MPQKLPNSKVKFQNLNNAAFFLYMCYYFIDIYKTGDYENENTTIYLTLSMGRERI